MIILATNNYFASFQRFFLDKIVSSVVVVRGAIKKVHFAASLYRNKNFVIFHAHIPRLKAGTTFGINHYFLLYIIGL